MSVQIWRKGSGYMGETAEMMQGRPQKKKAVSKIWNAKTRDFCNELLIC